MRSAAGNGYADASNLLFFSFSQDGPVTKAPGYQGQDTNGRHGDQGEDIHHAKSFGPPNSFLAVFLRVVE